MMMMPRTKENLWTQTKRLTSLIQLYEEAFVEGDHHIPAMRPGKSEERKKAYPLEQNLSVCVLYAEYVEENIADLERLQMPTNRMVVLCVRSFTVL